MARKKPNTLTLPPIIIDPEGYLHGLPCFLWNAAPDGYLTRRQLAAKGLRRGGQPVAALLRRGRRLYAFLYLIDLAKPQFTKTEAKQAAVWTAARSRYRCGGPCGRTDLDYIPRQAAPCWGVCWDCLGLPAPEPQEQQ